VAHGLRGERAEVGAAIEVGALAPDQLHVRLVDQRRGVERPVPLPAPTLAVGQVPELVVQDPEHLVERLAIAVPHALQEPRDGLLHLLHHESPPCAMAPPPAETA
jgi:hypothetical protein